MPKNMAKNKIDSVLLLFVLLILLFGFLILFSVSAPISQQKFGNTYFYLAHQALFGLLPGLVLGFLVFKIRLETLKKWSIFLFLANLVLCLMVFLPSVGVKIGGARRWLTIGSFSFQPAELLKITLPLYLAAWLNTRYKNDLMGLLSFLLILLPVGLILIFQPDISTLSLLLIISLLTYFLSKTPFWHTLLMIVMGVSLILFLINLAPYRMARFLVFADPNLDPMGIGYQIKQSLIAIGSGGLWGRGVGFSKQKAGFLPNVLSDSIFSVFSEEMGFVGALTLISLFAAFFFRVVQISKRLRDPFARVLGTVLGAGLVLQAFFNIGAMIGIIPLTGTPLPFISYGGTHLVVELISIGLILNISRLKT